MNGCTCYVFILLVLLQTQTLHAQNSRTIGIDTQYGFVWAHTKGIENTSASRPQVIQFSYNAHYNDSMIKNTLGFFLQKGWLFQWVDFRLPVLGQLYTVAHYLQPTWEMGSGFHFGLRAIGGIGIGTHPYDVQLNNKNQSYSSLVNPFLSIGLQLQYELSRTWILQTHVQYNHISNGGMSKPNKGVNWPTVGLGVASRINHPVSKLHFKESSIAQTQLELIGYGSMPMREELIRQRYEVVGLGVKLARRGKVHGWTLGCELAHDELFRASALKKTSSSPNSVWSGILAGHEFMLGKFIFSQELGIYVYQPVKVHNDWYHRWGLLYYPLSKWGIGINLKAHGEQANFIDLRMVYTIKK